MAVLCVVAFVVLKPEADPQAYPGSSPGYGLDDFPEFTGVGVPDCAHPTARFYFHPPVPENATLDFTAPAECVDRFLTDLGVDAARPKDVWSGSGEPPILPNAEAGARWEFLPGDQVELWSTVKHVGDLRNGADVEIAVNRSSDPQQVHMVTYPRVGSR